MSSPKRRSSKSRTRVTIYEVAERAGVSVATVSKALNRPDTVAAATRARVLQLVDELGFTPGGAGGARSGVSRIAVIAPFSAYETYLTRLVGVVAACSARQVEVTVVDDDGRTSLASRLTALAAPGRADGLLVMGATPDAEATELLLRRKVPTVLLDASSPEFTSITIDDEYGGRLLAEHLLASGVTSLVCAGPAPPDSTQITSGERRMSGLHTAFVKHHVDTPIEWLLCADTVAGGREAAADLLEMRTRPHAVVAVHDVLAAGLVGGLRDLGVAVPAEIAVTGYDDTDIAAALGITTVRQPFEQSGAIAANALVGLIDDPDAPRQHIQLLPELIVRATAPGTDEPESTP